MEVGARANRSPVPEPPPRTLPSTPLPAFPKVKVSLARGARDDLFRRALEEGIR